MLFIAAAVNILYVASRLKLNKHIQTQPCVNGTTNALLENHFCLIIIAKREETDRAICQSIFLIEILRTCESSSGNN